MPASRLALALVLALALLPLLQAGAQQPGPARPGSAAPQAFHEGARLFIQGNREAAARAVEAGLALTPADARLQALLDLIRQPPSSPSGGGDRPDQGQDGQSGEGPEDAPPESPGSDGAPRPEAPPATEQPGASGAPRPEAPPAEPEARGPMSRAEAERLLEAVGGDERLWQREVRRRTAPPPLRGGRDW